MASKPRILLICGICTAILFVVMLAIGIFTVAFLDNILISKAASQAAMTPGKYQNWGQLPGGYKANVTRRYIFFNFTNPFDVFYLNATPVFAELPSQLYAENQNLLNAVYHPQDSDGATSVDFGFQLFTTPIAAVPTDNITTLNLGPLGFWYSAPRLPDSQLASYTISALVNSLELDIVTTLESAAIKFQCATAFDTTAHDVFNTSQITDPDLQNLLWNDPVNGLGARETILQWVHAIANGPDSGAAKILGDYFYLDYTQLEGLFGDGNHLKTCVGSLNTTIKNGYHCVNNPCDPDYFVKLQWSTQNVTKEPAGGIIDPEPSVVFFNNTVSGFPEISYYFNSKFLLDWPVNASDYSNVTWTVDMAETLLNFTTFSGAADDYCTEPDTLLHMGNLAFVYQYGEQFDAAGDITNLDLLAPIQNRFNLPSPQHAHVLWKYIQYLKDEFAVKSSVGGTVPELILGQFASQALYTNFTTMLDFIPFDLTARIILSNITAAGLNCTTLLTGSAALITQEEADTLCQSPYLSPLDIDVVKTLYISCARPNGPEYTALYQNLSMKKAHLNMFCNTLATNSFFSFMQYSENYLKDFYGCSPNYAGATRCSNSELAVMQWGESKISQNVPAMLADQFNPSLSISDWYPELIPQPFEYLAVLQNKLSKIFENDTSAVQPIPYNISNQLLTFNTLFSQVVVQTAFISYKTQDWQWFETVLFGVTPYPMITYLRYIMMEIALGGFYQTRSVNDLLWGYDDPFLTKIKNSSPYSSGDPSLNNFVTLAGPNCTSADEIQFSASMYTGTNDSTLTRQFISINGLPIINYNKTYFNGTSIVSEFISPWEEDIPVYGTDGVINHPGLSTSDTVPLYISDLNFQAELVYSGSNQEYSGLESYRYVVPASALQSSSANQKWFMDQWDGLINISMVHNAPLFVSKGRFLDVNSTIQDAVKIYQDSSLSTLVTPTDTDNLYVDIEPYSGGAVGTSASLQANYEFKQDPLFSNPNYAMLPIVLTQRGMSFTSDQVSTVYGELLTGLQLKHLGPLICFPLAAVFLIISIALFLRRRNLLKKRTLLADDGSYNQQTLTKGSGGANPLEGYVSSSRQQLHDISAEEVSQA